MSTTGRKRKGATPPEDSGVPSKKPRAAKSAKGKKGTQPDAPVWPEYFNSLFKALNTVLAFCSSRKNFAITFPVVRASVEAMLHEPLELAKVAELKALLPEIVKFAYTPRIELRIHSDHQPGSSRRERSPDYSAFRTASASSSLVNDEDEDEHVLVLDFIDNSRGKKPGDTGLAYALPPALTPAATKKLVERRNNRFVQAVNELLKATPESEDPVTLLQSAAREHIPVHPGLKDSAPGASQADVKVKYRQIPEPEHRPSIEEVIADVEQQDWYQEQIQYRRIFEARQGQLATLEPPLSDTISQALRDSRKITSLYTHQVSAINALARHKHVIVSTSTASGKSVIYQVPFLQFLEADPDSTAIFVYPTKALAQDQRAALEQLLYSCPGLNHVKVSTYDGDTPQELRAGIRDTSSVIFTNFDMLHASILPHEDQWRRFLKNLKLVAIDELHYYSGIFGSHVARVMRRLRRVCAAVGNRRARFVSCSATISKPRQHMQNISGIEESKIEAVTEDGAPAGRKDFLVWNPPLKDPMDHSLGRLHSMTEATRLMRFLMARGVRVILFCKIRKSCELAMKTLRQELSADGRHDILERVMSYRGGYSQEDRRRIEREAFSGNLLGIVATNALELGVDIGVLDAVIMLGFPIGGLASFRQQTGRAGRRARDALSILVADALPVDQHYVNHPEELFDRATDELMIDLESKIILEAHLQCAAHEMPITAEDEVYFGGSMVEICEAKLTKDKEGWYHTHPRYLPYPSKHVSIRGAEEEKYSVVDVTRIGKPGGTAHILEEIELSRALFEIYEGAVFIHQGLTFLVQEVSHDSKMAKLVRSDVNWITEPRDFTNVDAIQTTRIREIKGSPHRAFYGRIELFTLVYGYFKLRNKAIIDAVDLDTPAWQRETTGLWLDVPKPVLQMMYDHGINPAEAIHAACHAFLNRFALAADLRTECKVPEKEYKASASQRKRPARLIFYEPSGKTGGVAVKAFDHVNDILRDAHDRVESCDCDEGCTACVVSSSCKEGNVVSSKVGALIVLKALLGQPIDVDLLEEGLEENQAIYDTVVEATSVRLAEGVEVERSM
ncbi:P-loop containing nucleoside triphosphate hydrolase protein [Dichomitus squalens LYAD-421 SS1]|uniref:P-loop containing nucleoside triphosphate hydrolase protein n=1 Tax=Dichomitus squalens (strain LYAD-421) TaxID=732165 RepID=UPI0004414DB8|nr:P-loop containing nucleoside triphosphate hydrolase protein [Dichomitus squalens LYAD-421 SS1]EJF65709.1 P-loop containing nucleoside triphosphate hydrolase protein [Dichomitus squalens LYAD-421 SS1]